MSNEKVTCSLKAMLKSLSDNDLLLRGAVFYCEMIAYIVRISDVFISCAIDLLRGR